MKIYTRTGDDGTTGLFGGPRVPKNDQRIAAYGTIDELNSLIGLARSLEVSAEIDAGLARIQHELFAVGAELATPEPESHHTDFLTDHQVGRLELEIDRFDTSLPELKNFILPGGGQAGATLHVARCVCRRAERQLVTLGETAPVRAALMQYVNRLSDLLFVLARATNASNDCLEQPWEK
ncbi:cob(I)yrinic acid a,c-diamide adenosyltransferase [Adhaeretor mobilis]|uniref:Corrinoid adenosyltransferase n=1 Tax=Adhaeretor mobilis TaxID=1930276 RepID=A0A517MZK9_9BACT|nr:cob(I)yrinic acid a,c-diamide adenosyltransferase [Adhaeretor mobilis]QDT00319.1 Cob(I)yrinic acid a,c-diamide adenosyltransferase [Adhaeretor mobilis]